MTRNYLEGLKLDKETIDAILDENMKDIGREKGKAEQYQADLARVTQSLADRDKDLEDLRTKSATADDTAKQLADLQAKYTTETENYQKQIAERDYMDAINSALSGVKFSSKAAKNAFVADLKEKKLELKDGKLDGFDDYLKSQKEADPEAFALDKPAPMIRPIGGGGAPTPEENKGAMYAKQFNAQYAKPANS